MIIRKHRWVYAPFLVLVVACHPGQPANSQSTQSDGVVRWELPGKLREISGLALTGDQRLLAVTDEEAIVYEYDYHNGRMVKAFALGKPTLRGDFEGIAVLNETVWLMNSKGDLYSANEGDDGERVEYRKHKFEFKDDCELEGLAADEDRNVLILVCKDANKKKNRLIFEWSMDADSRKFRLPEAEIAARLGTKRVHPSGIEVDPQTGDLVVVASRENAIFTLSRNGDFLDVIMDLDRSLHRQAEGITVTRDGRLLIADEAANDTATLTIYPSYQDGLEK